jgi:hypothetical protein
MGFYDGLLRVEEILEPREADTSSLRGTVQLLLLRVMGGEWLDDADINTHFRIASNRDEALFLQDTQ